MTDILIISPEITKGMKSVGSKCLLPLKGNLSVIEYQIKNIQQIYKYSNKITLNIGFDAENIKKKLYRYKNVRYLINKEFEITNQGQNLISYIHEYKPKNLFVLSSGVLLKSDAFDIKQIDHKECSILMLNKKKDNFNIGASGSPSLQYLFFDMEEAWSECFYLNEKAIKLLSKHSKSVFQQMYLFEIINFLLDNNIQFNKLYINKNKIMKIANIKDLTKARVFV